MKAYRLDEIDSMLGDKSARKSAPPLNARALATLRWLLQRVELFEDRLEHELLRAYPQHTIEVGPDPSMLAAFGNPIEEWAPSRSAFSELSLDLFLELNASRSVDLARSIRLADVEELAGFMAGRLAAFSVVWSPGVRSGLATMVVGWLLSAGYLAPLGDRGSVHQAIWRILLEDRCSACGCTDAKPCLGGCSWVDSDRCSACFRDTAV